MKKPFLIGVDEAGRGPLAGPVSVGVFAVVSSQVLKRFHGVKDSKQLSEKQREEWFTLIKSACIKGEACYAVSFSHSGTIDEKGLTAAVYSALNRSLRKIEKKGMNAPAGKILLDGLLYASSRYSDQRTIINGDATEPIIALASICAKVVRDRHMKRVALKYPEYGFEIHKGYGTKAHYKALKKHGPSEVHRMRFLRK